MTMISRIYLAFFIYVLLAPFIFYFIIGLSEYLHVSFIGGAILAYLITHSFSFIAQVLKEKDFLTKSDSESIFSLVSLWYAFSPIQAVAYVFLWEHLHQQGILPPIQQEWGMIIFATPLTILISVIGSFIFHLTSHAFNKENQ